ncbi:hypothetical protein RRG08_008509 [Elysia crispata]|uniref:Uncharacterized protein n=1 Tax=Elysia crispata TaxID=231223 RepID=A0AAE0Z8C4_9GAST|nr:hypothetical protein RRG08_008509 [Elysia crispata]
MGGSSTRVTMMACYRLASTLYNKTNKSVRGGWVVNTSDHGGMLQAGIDSLKQNKQKCQGWLGRQHV